MNCVRHHWISDRMECLHCAAENGWKIVLNGFNVGNHGHLVYALTKRGELTRVMESCPLVGGWTDRKCYMEMEKP